jgi:response regulator RpfG family c-di-GMP phosphodiesterase
MRPNVSATVKNESGRRASMRQKILLVDDEKDVLDGYSRVLRKQYNVLTAESAAKAFKVIDPSEPPYVVVSDFRMPEMDGATFLAEMRARYPSSVRMMLTGQADFESTIKAVNEGNIFRFLTKPCPVDTLVKALDAGIEQYQLLRAEKELLEKTLQGAVKALTEILALAQPGIFGRISRVRRLVSHLATEMKEEKSWQWEIATMLSQIGCITFSAELQEKVRIGAELAGVEKQIFEGYPMAGAKLIANIPRLETIAEIVTYQEKNYDGSGSPEDDKRGVQIPQGARALHVAIAYDKLLSKGYTPKQAWLELHDKQGTYDPEVMLALGKIVGLDTTHVLPPHVYLTKYSRTAEPPPTAKVETKTVSIRHLTDGMILGQDVHLPNGILLLGKGQEVTPPLRLRLENLAKYSYIGDFVEVEK